MRQTIYSDNFLINRDDEYFDWLPSDLSIIENIFEFVENDEIIKQLKTMIDTKKLLNNYDIEHRQSHWCLWW